MAAKVRAGDGRSVVTLGIFYGVSLRFEGRTLSALRVGVHRKERIEIQERLGGELGQISHPAPLFREVDDPEVQRLNLDPGSGRQARQTVGQGVRTIEVFQGKGMAGEDSSDKVTALARLTFALEETAEWILLLPKAQGYALEGEETWAFDLLGRTRLVVCPLAGSGLTLRPQYGWGGNVVGVKVELPAGRQAMVDLLIESRPEYDVNDTIIVCQPHQAAEAAIVATCLPTRKFQPIIDLPLPPQKESQRAVWERRLQRFADLVKRLSPQRFIYLHPYPQEMLATLDPRPDVEQIVFLRKDAALEQMAWPEGHILCYKDYRELAELAWQELSGQEEFDQFPLPQDRTKFYPFGTLDALRKGRPLLLKEMDFVLEESQVADIVNDGVRDGEGVIVEDGTDIAAVIGALYANYVQARLYVNREPDVERVAASLQDFGDKVEELFQEEKWPEGEGVAPSDLVSLITSQVDDYIRSGVGDQHRLTVFTAGMPYTFVQSADGERDWSRLTIGHVIGEPAMIVLREVMARAYARPPLSFSVIFDPGYFAGSEADWTSQRLAQTLVLPLALQGPEANYVNLKAYPESLPVEGIVFVTHGARESILLKDSGGSDIFLSDRDILLNYDFPGSPVIFNNSCLSWVGVGRAFVGAGARGYIGTLWSVDSLTASSIARQTIDLMLGEGKTVGEALTTAEVDDELSGRAYIYVGTANSQLGAWEYAPEQQAEVTHGALELLASSLAQLVDRGYVTQSRTLYSKYQEMARAYLALSRDPAFNVPPTAAVDILLEEAYYLAKLATREGQDTAQEVMVRCQKALDDLERLPLDEDEADQRRALAWGRMAYVELEFGRWEEALAHYRRSLDVLCRLGDQPKVAACWHQIGRIHQGRGEWEEAETNYRESLALREVLGDRQGMALANAQLGALYLDQGWLDEALHYLGHSLALCQEVGDELTKSQVLLSIGLVHQGREELEGAWRHFRESLAIAEHLQDKQGVATCLHNMGNLHYRQGRWTEALGCYRQSLSFFQELGDREGEADSLHEIGLIHQSEGRFEEALGCYGQSLEIYEAMGHRQGQAKSLLFRGMVYQEQERWAQARDSYEEALALVTQLGDETGQEILVQKIGSLPGSRVEGANHGQQAK